MGQSLHVNLELPHERNADHQHALQLAGARQPEDEGPVG